MAKITLFVIFLCFLPLATSDISFCEICNCFEELGQCFGIDFDVLMRILSWPEPLIKHLIIRDSALGSWVELEKGIHNFFPFLESLDVKGSGVCHDSSFKLSFHVEDDCLHEDIQDCHIQDCVIHSPTTSPTTPTSATTTMTTASPPTLLDILSTDDTPTSDPSTSSNDIIPSTQSSSTHTATITTTTRIISSTSTTQTNTKPQLTLHDNKSSPNLRRESVSETETEVEEVEMWTPWKIIVTVLGGVLLLVVILLFTYCLSRKVPTPPLNEFELGQMRGRFDQHLEAARDAERQRIAIEAQRTVHEKRKRATEVQRLREGLAEVSMHGFINPLFDDDPSPSLINVTNESYSLHPAIISTRGQQRVFNRSPAQSTRSSQKT